VSDDPILIKHPTKFGVGRSLAFRAALVFTLIAIAVLGHWIDRDGLRDNIDGHISFVDVIYFTAITITTVGYGDITPVTEQARMFDTFVVTPIRIFVWLIFLGTAYTFVLRESWERVRTNMTKRSLHGHHVVCGFGHGGEAAVRELLRQGEKATHILVIDPMESRTASATRLGVMAIIGDAAHPEIQEAAGVCHARAVLVSAGRDDVASLIVLSVRQRNATVPISVIVRAAENEALLHQAGASCVINPVTFGGHLLARGAANQQAVAYLQDLVSADGHVFIRQRCVTTDEVGLKLRDLPNGVGVRVLRDGRTIDASAHADIIIAPSDCLLEIVVGGAQA
jgi:voltage-gated potassium channel